MRKPPGKRAQIDVLLIGYLIPQPDELQSDYGYEFNTVLKRQCPPLLPLSLPDLGASRLNLRALKVCTTPRRTLEF